MENNFHSLVFPLLPPLSSHEPDRNIVNTYIPSYIAKLSGIRVTEETRYFIVNRISARVPPMAGFEPEARQSD